MSNNIEEEVGIEEIHRVHLELLKQIAKICDEQKLTYYLYWGTLIGAIRHNGFIPWDDDADIVMLRPDYEKLIAYLAAHEEELYPLRLMHYSTNKKYLYPIARFCDTRYRVVSEREPVDYGLGIFIDIYPFDGWANRKGEIPAFFEERSSLLREFHDSLCKSFPPYRGSLRKLPSRWFQYQKARWQGLNRILRKMDNEAKKYPVEDYAFVGNLNWAVDEREGTEKANLVPVKHRFEDAEFTIPQGYDIILRDYYGDYMQFPPEEERIGHHLNRTYRKHPAEPAE